MADNRIPLDLDLGDSAQKAKQLASNLSEIRDAAQGVDQTASPLIEALANIDKGLVGLVPITDDATAKTTAFAASLERLDAVLRKVDDVETVFGKDAPKIVADTYEVLENVGRKVEARNKSLASSNRDVAESYQVLAGVGSNYAKMQEVQAANDKSVARAVEQTRAQAALREVLIDIQPVYQRKIGVVKGSADAMAEAGKEASRFGSSVLSTSYAIQDFTSVLGTQGLAGGLRAVQNNVPIIVQQLAAGGMSAASAASLAGAVGIVTVGVGLLVDNWESLVNLWSKASEAALPKLRGDLEGVDGTLARINKEISDLQEKSLTDALSFPEQERLGSLRNLQSQAQNQAAERRSVEGIGRDVGPERRQLIDDVKSAIGKAGGGEAVAMNLQGNIGGTYQEAVAIVADALRGSRDSISRLEKMAPNFGREFAKIDQKREADADAFFQKQQNEWNARFKDFQDQQEAADKQRAGRRARQEEEIRQAEQSTPEELRQSQALDYLDNFMKSREARQAGLGGLDLTNKEELGISEQMLRNNDAGLSARDSTIQALREFMDKRQQLRDNAFKTQLESEFASFAGMQGYNLNSDQIAGAAQSIFRMMQGQVDKDRAAILALQEVVQANAQMSGVIQSQQIMFGNIQQQARTTRTRLNRGR